MGQRLTPNPYGDCEACHWPYNYTPPTVTVQLSNVKAADYYPSFPLMNTLFTLTAQGNCFWQLFTSDVWIYWNLGITSTLYMEKYVPLVSLYLPYFVHESDVPGQTKFVNQLSKEDDFYYCGTAFVAAGLPLPVNYFVPSYSFLPGDNWKYEEMQASNGNRQVYLGSHKYKTNCRILFNPDELSP